MLIPTISTRATKAPSHIFMFHLRHYYLCDAYSNSCSTRATKATIGGKVAFQRFCFLVLFVVVESFQRFVVCLCERVCVCEYVFDSA